MILDNNSFNRKSGVALIIVLGLLAVLMITTVAFTTMMRVERSSSANLRHSTLARQIVNGALSYALADLDYRVGTNAVARWYDKDDPFYPYWTYMHKAKSPLPSEQAGTSKYEQYTLWKDTVVSIDAVSDPQIRKINIDKIYGEKNNPSAVNMEYVPRILTAEAERYIMPGNAYKGYSMPTDLGAGEPRFVFPQWIPIMTDGGDIIGRFAYMIFNESGRLDLGVVNGADRRMGQSPAEIQVARDIFGSEFSSNSQLEKLFDNRDKLGEFATVAEMTALGEAPDTVSSFDTCLYQPPASVESKVDISGSASDLEKKKKEIIEAFANSGLNDEQSKWAYLALIDYVDADGLPAGGSDEEKFCRPVSEEMPLFAGGEALVTIIRKQAWKSVPLGTDPQTYDAVPDPDNVTYELRVIGKVPFVWNFDKSVPNNTFECEGKLAVLDADSDAKFSGLFNGLKTVTMRSKFTQQRYPVYPDDNSHLNWIIHSTTDKVNEKCQDGNGYIEPDYSGLKMDICFAGSTYNMKEDGARVRVFPFNVQKYESSDSADIGNYWLKVSLNLKREGVVPLRESADKKYTTVIKESVTLEDGSVKSVDLACWVAHKIVWTELFDPAYACKGMKKEADELRSVGAYRPSVDSSYKKDNGTFANKANQFGLIQGAPTQYLSSMRKTSSAFSDFSAADPDETAFNRAYDPKESKEERDENDSNEFVESGYFKGRGAVSQLTDFILENPELLGGGSGDDEPVGYGIRADGLQYRSGARSCDTAFVQKRRFVRNCESDSDFPSLESVGELGYIQVAPYTTIKLYDHEFEDMFRPDDGFFAEYSIPDSDLGYHTVLDYFTTSPSPRGKININTSERNVLASAFFDMPLNNEYNIRDFLSSPKDTDKPAVRLNKGRAFNMVDLLAGLSSEIGGFGKLSDLGKIYQIKGLENSNGRHDIVAEKNMDLGNLSRGAQIIYASIKDPNLIGDDGKRDSTYGLKSSVRGTLNANVFDNDSGGDKTKRFGEFERESLIRNVCGLFGTGGQIFTIAIRAESFAPFYGAQNVLEGTVNAAKTGIAHVWRSSVAQKGPALDNQGTGAQTKTKRKPIYPFEVLYFKIIDE